MADNFLEPDDDTSIPLVAPSEQMPGLAGHIRSKFEDSENGRFAYEQRWIQAYKNFRGIYDSTTQYRDSERSKVFIKITKTKVLAAYGQIVDVLFGNNKFPINVDPTTLPEGVAESVHFNLDPAATDASEELNQTFAPFSTEESKLQPGETMQQLSERLGGMANKLAPVMDKLIEGPGTTPSTVTVRPAQIAAKKMQKKIHDQLEESGANKQLRLAAFECALFGTGIMKGPFATNKEYPRWDDEGNYDPIIKTVPSTSNVSIWDFYPDPDAANMDEAEYIIERHKMSRSQVRALKGRPFFRDNAIDKSLAMGESYEKKWWEQAMEDDAQSGKAERYEVHEFWGFVDKEVLKEYDVDIPKELKNTEQK